MALILSPYRHRQFYRGYVSNIPVINESITPGPHMEFCNRLRSVLLANESGVVTMSDLPELPRIDEEDYMYNLYCWDCEHVRTPHEFVKRGFVKLDTGTDPRMALLWFMAVSGTPHGTVRANIFNNCSHIIEKINTWIEPHVIDH